ncbi:MAG: biotin/lipoyl-containing protein [Armatimonadota bacterium]
MNHDQIDAIASVLRNSPTLTELEVRNAAGVSLRLRRPSALVTRAAVPVPATAPSGVAVEAKPSSEREHGTAQLSGSTPLTATMVGIFRALSGDAAVTFGTVVKEGQLVGHIEAMRLMNDCLAPESGTVFNMLVEEGQPVEYGQLLFEIGPEA